MKITKFFSISLLSFIFSNALAVNWSYSGATGAAAWGSLKPGYRMCATGTQQSPVDLGEGLPLKDAHVRLHYRLADFYLRQTTHNLYQDSVKPSKNYLVYNGQPYNLLEIHFHVPAEHKINGYQYPMEAHLVHQNSKGQLLVLGVFLKEGSANAYLENLLNSSQFQILSEEVETPIQLNPLQLTPSELLGRAKEYYVYPGSLTTPPCVEGVTWIVAKEPVEVSKQQLNTFKAEVTNFNARPIQKIGKRELGFEQ